MELSECCDAPPLNGIVEEWDEIKFGRCSKCKERCDFWEDDSEEKEDLPGFEGTLAALVDLGA